MKLGQLMEYIREIFFFKNCAGNETGRLVPDLFSLFKNPQNKVKEVVCSLVSIGFDSPQPGIQQKQTV